MTLHLNPNSAGTKTKSSIEDDFAFGSNVASSSMYIRMGFLRKVYGIVSVQLIFTTIVAAFFMLCEPVAEYMKTSQWPLMVSMFGSFGVLFALMVKSREVPTNYILLAIFTLFESLMVGTVVTFYQVHSVIQAFVLTCIVTVSLTAYTFQTKRDFSNLGVGLFTCLWVLIWAGFLQMIFQSPMMDLAIGIGGAILFSLFIVFDTWMIMHKVSPEEYIHASINLYLDILNLFLHILRILGDRK